MRDLGRDAAFGHSCFVTPIVPRNGGWKPPPRPSSMLPVPITPPSRVAIPSRRSSPPADTSRFSRWRILARGSRKTVARHTDRAARDAAISRPSFGSSLAVRRPAHGATIYPAHHAPSDRQRPLPGAVGRQARTSWQDPKNTPNHGEMGLPATSDNVSYVRLGPRFSRENASLRPIPPPAAAALINRRYPTPNVSHSRLSATLSKECSSALPTAQLARHRRSSPLLRRPTAAPSSRSSNACKYGSSTS